MMRSHDELREALGAHALGQLDDRALQRDLEEHLAGCDECRAELEDIAPLAAALRGVDPDAVGPLDVATPPELDERIRGALPRPVSRVRRLAPIVGGALAGAAAAAVVTVLLVQDDGPAAPTIIAVPGVETVDGVTATAGLVDHTWGLEVKLEATGLPAGETFEMWVVGADGTAYEAGEFIGVEGRKIVCDMSSSVLLRDAARFKVVDTAGDEVIAADVPS
ncbi:MAG: zf-HC2 domain-containing protein [Aeromicrobium sp.]